MSNVPSLKLNDSPVSPAESVQSTTSQSSRKDLLQKAIRPRLATKYLWDFYHEKTSAGADYPQRLTLYNDTPIDSWENFWRCWNNYPFGQLQEKDSIHWFKHLVKPTWEDARNQDGGAWYFRVSESATGKEGKTPVDVLEQVLLMTVNGYFDDVVQPPDDICGVSFTRRQWGVFVVAIWTRRADEEKTILGIKDLMFSQLSPRMKTMLEGGKNSYYKKHREHADFDTELAKRLKDEYDARKSTS